MSPTTQRARSRKRKKSSRIPRWLQIFWPLLAGILITPFAVRAASILAMSGPAGLRLLYPFVILVETHAQSFASAQEETLSQWVMYAQFPAYGLVWIAARQLTRGAAGALSVVALHCVGVAAAIF